MVAAIDDTVVILSKGDITKRDYILDNFTYSEVEPYLRKLEEDHVFKETVTAALGGKNEWSEQRRAMTMYRHTMAEAGKEVPYEDLKKVKSKEADNGDKDNGSKIQGKRRKPIGGSR